MLLLIVAAGCSTSHNTVFSRYYRAIETKTNVNLNEMRHTRKAMRHKKRARKITCWKYLTSILLMMRAYARQVHQILTAP